jgi:hypothetical protein
MKNRILILVCMVAWSVLSLRAADTDRKPVSADERLRETDLALTLQQYERVRMEAFDARLKLDLLETEGQMTPEDREKKIVSLEKKIMILRQRADELRAQAIKLGEDETPRTALDVEKSKLKEMLNRYSAEHPSVKKQQERIRDLEANTK